MKIKYFVVMVVGVLMGTQVMNAQNNEHGKKPGRKPMTLEQMADMQARKIVGELGLDDKTAAKFTDVYKKYMTELNDLRKEYMPKRPEDIEKEKQAPFMPTDAEVDKMMRDRFNQSRKMLDVREKYYDEFRKFLTPKQVQKVYDQGQMNRGKFHKEVKRRAEMKKHEGGKRTPSMHGKSSQKK